MKEGRKEEEKQKKFFPLVSRRRKEGKTEGRRAGRKYEESRKKCR